MEKQVVYTGHTSNVVDGRVAVNFYGRLILTHTNKTAGYPNDTKYHIWHLYEVESETGEKKYRVYDEFHTLDNGMSDHYKLTKEMTLKETAKKYPEIINEAIDHGLFQVDDVTEEASNIDYE
jgi:predicted SnoaL-like aldol condensation-catalyzing enzyme